MNELVNCKDCVCDDCAYTDQDDPHTKTDCFVTSKHWYGTSSYGCKYRVDFNPKGTKGVKLGIWNRIKLFCGAELVIAHH